MRKVVVLMHVSLEASWQDQTENWIVGLFGGHVERGPCWLL